MEALRVSREGDLVVWAGGWLSAEFRRPLSPWCWLVLFVGCKLHCCFTPATFTLATCVKPSLRQRLDRVIATSCREQRNTSWEVAAVTVKLTLPVPGRNMVLRSNLDEDFLPRTEHNELRRRLPVLALLPEEDMPLHAGMQAVKHLCSSVDTRAYTRTHSHT